MYAFTRAQEHRDLARDLGAVWAGDSDEDPGVRLDAASSSLRSVSSPSTALRRLDKGGIVALGGIYSTPIPPIEYPWIYQGARRSSGSRATEDGRQPEGRSGRGGRGSSRSAGLARRMAAERRPR